MSARSVLCAAVLCAALLPPAGAAAVTPQWQLEQPTTAGAPYPVPLGSVGDISFASANRGVMTVEGNAAVPAGLFAYDGSGWHRLATVCGGTAANARVAFAGPTEFWTIADPSQGGGGSSQPGITLCHFVNGVVVGSYATLDNAEQPYAAMDAAVCTRPSDCWFSGRSASTASGSRRGSFHLHWDGAALTIIYGPQGRAVSSLAAVGGQVFESTFLGAKSDSETPARIRDPEPLPLLLHRVSLAGIFSDPWVPAPVAGVPVDGTELVSSDVAGGLLWEVGGGAASGRPADPDTTVVQRGPVAAVLEDGLFRQLNLPAGVFAPEERFVDVAAVPGTDTAWVAVEAYPRRGDPQGNARVALLHSDGTVTDLQDLPATGGARGTAQRIACAAADDCWLATSTGWLFHLSDGLHSALDSDAAFAGVITQRPNDGRSPQPILDTPPEDLDPPAPPDPVLPIDQTKPTTLPKLITKVKSRLVHGRNLEISFTSVRKARIGLLGQRHGRTVARTAQRTLRPGRHTIVLVLDPKHWPTKLKYVITEPKAASKTTTTTTTSTPASTVR